MTSLEERAGATTGSGRTQVYAGMLMVITLAAMDASIVATVIPPIVGDLGGFSIFPWLFSVYLLAQAASVPIYSKLADLYGRKPVLLAGVLIFLLGSVLCGAAWNMGALIAFRGVQGLGAGGILPISLTVVGDLYTPVERARVQGWLSGVWGVSALVGPAIGGAFAEYATWRWIFYINLPIGAVALFMVATRLHEQVVRRPRRLDVAGSLLVFVGTGLLVFGLLEGGVRWAWISAPSIGVLAAAVLALGAFVVQERRAAEPTVPGWVLTRRASLGTALANVVIGLLLFGMTTYLPTYAQGVLGASALAAGFTLSAMSLGWSLASTLSSRLYLRLGFRDAALVGTGLVVTGAVAFGILPGSSPLWAAAVAGAVLGAGLGLPSTSLLIGMQSVVPWERRGVVTGTSQFARSLGGAVGAAALGGIANATMAGWLRQAPPALRDRLPSVNAASDVLGGGATEAGGAVASYVRHGLDLASHRIFYALAVAAVLGVAAVLIAPRRFTPLRFDGVDPDADPGPGRPADAGPTGHA